MPTKSKSQSNGGHDFDASRVMEEAKSAFDESIADARASLEEIADEAQSQARRLGEQTPKFVRDNPGVALAGAVGLGVLVGLALRSR